MFVVPIIEAAACNCEFTVYAANVAYFSLRHSCGSV